MSIADAYRRCASAAVSTTLAATLLTTLACDARVVASPPPSPDPPGPPRWVVVGAFLPFQLGPVGHVWPAGAHVDSTRVIVSDRFGRVVPQASVSCRTDSRSTIEHAAATTDMNGVATCGRWTLRGEPSINRLIVAVGALAPETLSVQSITSDTVLVDGHYRLDMPEPVISIYDDDAFVLLGAELSLRNGRFELTTRGRTTRDARERVEVSTGAIRTAAPLLRFVVDGQRVDSAGVTSVLVLSGREIAVVGDRDWPRELRGLHLFIRRDAESVPPRIQ